MSFSAWNILIDNFALSAGKFNPLTPKIWLSIPSSGCHIFSYKSYKNLVLDQDNNFYLISLSILMTCLPDNVSYYREKLHVNHSW